MSDNIYFLIWWGAINCLVYIAEIYFFQNFIGRKTNTRATILYVLISTVLTLVFMTVDFSEPIKVLLSPTVILCFAKVVLKIKWLDMIAPITIIFTISTFRESILLLAMNNISITITNKFHGLMLQVLISVILALLTSLTLWLIAKRYTFTTEPKVPSYLYVLLLPSAFIVLAIRSILEPANSLLTNDFIASFWVIGSIIVFFVIIELFSKIVTTSKQESDSILLNSRLNEQRTYIEEAKKRNLEYRSFHHDINNHFLIVKGLIAEKKYDNAEKYLSKLNIFSDELIVEVDTGNTVVDILLKEKLKFAKMSCIKVVCNVKFSDTFTADDMDLCVIFSNAIDNAITAQLCVLKEKRYISIITKMRNDFLYIEIHNYLNSKNCALKYGTGLNNILRTAEKYSGTLEVEQSEDKFILTVLLCGL